MKFSSWKNIVNMFVGKWDADRPSGESINFMYTFSNAG